MDELFNLDALQQVLQEYAREAEEVYRYQISLGAKNASRNLFDSIRCNVVVDGQDYSVTMNLAHYWKYIEGGSKGTETSPPGAVYPAHFPPPSVLERWIEVKPILPHPDSNGRIPSPQSLAFLIGRKIQRHGIEPYPALEQTKKELNDIYGERIAEALGHDVQNFIRKVMAEK